MQTSSSPGELVSYLESYKMECLLAAVDRKCFDEENNYFTNTEDFDSAKEFILIYDSDYPEKYKPGIFDISKQSDELIERIKNNSRDENDFCRDMCSTLLSERILQLAESGYPLIFNSLDFMNRCFGFVCFFFRDYFISNYSNTMSVTNCVSIGIGGYINIQYQRLLLEKMDEMYRHDPLTGLYNRTGFMNAFKKMKNLPEYKNKSVTIIMSDMDGLKYINDHFGHAEGDSSIVAVANALFNAVPETSLSTRFGGDEVFSVIFEDTNPEEIINKMDLYLDRYNEKSGKPYKVSTSSGYVVTVLSDNFDITQEIKSADEDMYKNKGDKYSSRGQVGNLIERSLA
jgi:diguanylate cyclase (GGDEF)-like protein